jgi:rhomboid protease GluP
VGVTLLALLILAGIGVSLMTADERAWLAGATLRHLRRIIEAAAQLSPSGDPFHDALRARTRWLLVTPALVTTNVLVFTFILFGAGSFGDPATLVGWGANFAPRTLNGEWWRLLSATFVHAGLFHVIFMTAGLIPLGMILERAIGPIAFASVYMVAALLSNLVSLWTMPPMTVTAGASGAVCAVYGLSLASVLWALIARASNEIPIITAKQVGIGAGLFLLYNLATDHLPAASELTGLVTGFASGILLARHVTQDRAALRHAGWVTAATVTIAVALAFPLRWTPDRVMPEIVRIVALEERTARTYDEAVISFRRRRITADALAKLIEKTIVPELQVARGRLRTLGEVPPEHAPLVAAAEDYIQLREQSWRRRAQGLLESDLRILRDADEAEQAAFARFRTLKPV